MRKKKSEGKIVVFRIIHARGHISNLTNTKFEIKFVKNNV